MTAAVPLLVVWLAIVVYALARLAAANYRYGVLAVLRIYSPVTEAERILKGEQ